MAKTVKTKCQNCESDISTEYIRLGMQVECSHCLQATIPQIPSGTKLPVLTWEISYRDFSQLVKEKAFRKKVSHFFEEKLGYKIEDQSADSLILNDKNEAIDPLWLHLKMQNSSDLQYQLYQLAMSLWR